MRFLINFRGLLQRYFLATKSLKHNLDILINKANNKSNYISKVHSLLNGNSAYQKLRSNPYSTVTKSFRRNLIYIGAKCPDPKFLVALEC